MVAAYQDSKAFCLLITAFFTLCDPGFGVKIHSLVLRYRVTVFSGMIVFIKLHVVSENISTLIYIMSALEEDIPICAGIASCSTVSVVHTLTCLLTGGTHFFLQYLGMRCRML